MQPRVTVTISNWAMAGWAVKQECVELANGVEEEDHSGLEPTLFAHQLGSLSLPPGAWNVRRLVGTCVCCLSGHRSQDQETAGKAGGSAGNCQSTERNLWVRSWSPRRESLLGSSGKPVWEALPALSSLWS